MRLRRTGVLGHRAGRGGLRPIDELERSLDRLRLDGGASRQLLDGVLASEDVIGAFADAEAIARAIAAVRRRRPAVVARPIPRLAFATVVLASTMSVGTAFAQDLPAIAELAVARIVALIEGPVPVEAAAEAPVIGSPWRETPATNPRAPEPVTPPAPASPESAREPEPPAPAAALEPTPAAEPAEAHVEPPPAQPEQVAEEPRPADEPVPVPDRAVPPLPDGGVFEELEPIVEPEPAAELPSLPEATADPPVVAEEPDAPAEEPVDEEPVEAEEPPTEEPMDEEDPPTEEPVDEELVDDDDEGKEKKDKKEEEDHADEHAHEHADEHAAIHDEDQP